jgi:hypothetical protein
MNSVCESIPVAHSGSARLNGDSEAPLKRGLSAAYGMNVSVSGMRNSPFTGEVSLPSLTVPRAPA